MRTCMQFFALIMAASQFAPALAQDAPRDPRIGNWDEQRSPTSDGMHVTYEDLGEGRFRLQYFPQRPPATRTVVEARCDGGTYSLVYGDGRPVGDSLSCRVTGPRTFSYLYTMGKPVTWVTSSGVETVSEDGKTLTWTAIHRDASGKIVEELHRQFSRRVQ